MELEVVPGIDDGSHPIGRRDLHDTLKKTGSTHAAGEHDDHLRATPRRAGTLALRHNAYDGTLAARTRCRLRAAPTTPPATRHNTS
ncbi:MAG: hypothetical protein OHK0015_45850 [Chloroflexi bacterium OHK40]